MIKLLQEWAFVWAAFQLPVPEFELFVFCLLSHL